MTAARLQIRHCVQMFWAAAGKAAQQEDPLKLPSSAYALFTSEGTLVRASETWGALTSSPLPAGTAWREDDVFAALGLKGSGGRYAVDGQPFAGEVTPMGDQLLVSLHKMPAREGYEPFLRVAAHDVRGPLANVRSYASLLLSPRFALDEKVRKGLDTIGRNSDRALALVQSLVDLWRYNEGGLLLERSHEPLPPLLEKAVARVGPGAARKVVAISVEIPEGLPPVMVDPDRIVVALTGLICNAIERSSPQGTVRVLARALEGGVEVSTLDNGPLLEAEERAQSFDFAKAAVSARKLDARFDLGLGAVLIAAHGGRSEAARAEGNQTRFSFWIPGDEAQVHSPAPKVGPP